MKLLFFFYFHIKKSIYGRFSALFLQKHHVFPCMPQPEGVKKDVRHLFLWESRTSFFSLYIYIYFIMSKPQYGINAFGMRMPSGVWLFSSKAATMRGKANAEPFKVWQSSVFLFAVR